MTDRILETLIEDLASFSSLPVPQDAVDSGTALVADLWRQKPRGMTETEWYMLEQVGRAYALDLAGWHLRGGGTPPEYVQFAGATVLDFGGGIGTFALRCAEAGRKVTVWEVNPWLREFIEYRALKHDLEIELLEPSSPYSPSPDIDPERRFNTVVCWHVFEHLPHPNEELALIKSILSESGTLISQSDFNRDGLHPMHHERRGWEQFMSIRGFVPRQTEPFVYCLASNLEKTLS